MSSNHARKNAAPTRIEVNRMEKKPDSKNVAAFVFSPNAKYLHAKCMCKHRSPCVHFFRFSNYSGQYFSVLPLISRTFTPSSSPSCMHMRLVARLHSLTTLCSSWGFVCFQCIYYRNVLLKFVFRVTTIHRVTLWASDGHTSKLPLECIFAADRIKRGAQTLIQSRVDSIHKTQQEMRSMEPKWIGRTSWILSHRCGLRSK